MQFVDRIGIFITVYSSYVAIQKQSTSRQRTESGEDESRKRSKEIVNIRLRPDQKESINAIVERSAILDTSKFAHRGGLAAAVGHRRSD